MPYSTTMPYPAGTEDDDLINRPKLKPGSVGGSPAGGGRDRTNGRFQLPDPTIGGPAYPSPAGTPVPATGTDRAPMLAQSQPAPIASMPSPPSQEWAPMFQQAQPHTTGSLAFMPRFQIDQFPATIGQPGGMGASPMLQQELLRRRLMSEQL